MKKVFVFILTLIALVATISLYANFLHPRIFFKKAALSRVNEAFLKKGAPITFQSGNTMLKGTVFTNAPAGRKVPLIVFCVGSAGSSYRSNYATMLDTMFLQNLPMDSIALLCFDKRGIGESDGNWYDADFEQRAADAKAAADFGAGLPFVDSSRIIIAGHSQGGWISQVALAKYPARFAAGISMAGPVFSVRKQLVNDYYIKYLCEESLTSEEALTKAEKQVDLDVMLASFFPFQQNWKQLQVIKNFDPADYLRNIHAPILFLWGTEDALVRPEWCRESMQHYFPQGMPVNFDTLTITGANHSFKLADRCFHGSYSQVPYADDCKEAMLKWLRQYF
ncbi:S9 family peptidase [Chitinophaga sp. Cy-1792]|uniref:alpha/beta hydrolase family protein n=1 Tax=Chitinophaga sp. Cy-1792 TaxID=2608339 RepID=UPI001420C5B3|nr:alpha/beta fold hydrolase [Chitinophaga sp. Cy-1792]NIG55078.1 alpha/beta fold hydrolase [Chitinophaga sp. Cy-1792]